LTGDELEPILVFNAYMFRGEMKRLLGKAGYKVRQLLVQSMGRGASAPTGYLAEVDGFVGKADTRLGRLKAMLGSRLQQLSPLGGYPVPLKGKR
jgi:hypothetical protein